MPWHVDAFGVVTLESPQLARVKAAKLGTGRILIQETPHFTESEQLKQEIPIMVYDPNYPQTAIAWEDITANAKTFHCRMPASWQKEVTGKGDADGVYGVAAYAERTWEDLVPYIQVEYFSRNNTQHSTPSQFMAACLDSGPLKDGQSHPAITAVTLYGRPCWSFEKKALEYTLPRSIDPAGVMAVKKYIVVPETDHSFFVLTMCVPADNVSYYQPFFDLVVQSFKPQVEAKSTF
jgi:hypothetical protein